ncbi:hypothetical protein B0I35DRAFT_516764 [Stachybotrys elegans]|uniref:Zn(2)-C6 fungal-type domain-containing protein n=1 Tax=Stachybotrys elegans TaxID=80388 RepID=A0A8K0WKF2_9HYPO|nr:hypothetical protein B0I35DRAFT_516764 [Stachybotrys elegans]
MPKPSFGCLTCRNRRVKCDERAGGCYNCERYGAACPGYQDRFDVMLRLRLPQPQTSLGLRTHDGWTPQEVLRGQQFLDNACATPNSTWCTLTIDRPLGLDFDDIGLAMYYSSHCIDGSPMWSQEHMQARGNGCLLAAVKVLGKITYLRKCSLLDGPTTVWRDYIGAVQLLNSALASPWESRTDSTLLATMIMSAIESMAAPSRSTDYWEVHTNGAAALLQLRGANQVTSRLGSTLFFQTCSNITTACILAGRKIPGDLYRLRNATQTLLIDPAHPVWKYQGAMFRFTDFVAATRSSLSGLQAQHVQHIITEALSIYTELLAVFRGADVVWQYASVPSTRFHGLVDYEHVYQTVLASQLWNGYRTALILLCTVVARIANCFPRQAGLDEAAQQFLDSAVGIINQVAVETIAAVPPPVPQMRSKASNILGSVHSFSDDELESHTRVFWETRPDTQAVPYMHGCQLQWAVYFAANCEFVIQPARGFLLDVLENAAKMMAIQQWKVSAAKLRQELPRV